ncbi:dipeptidase PepV [Paenibacillaceae bacterium]|nr:dipeptidase PepV [Paenibacillaceae bacterium]
MRIGQAIRAYEQDIIHHIQQLLRIDSVASVPLPGKPFGEGVDRALAYMLDLGRTMGFKTTNVDGYAGHVEYGSGTELVAVLVHLDTVPLGSGWTMEPLGGCIHEGNIYGRGAADNKGPAVVALYALKALKDAGIAPRKRVRVIFGTNEENGMTDMDYYFTKEPLPDYSFTPDAGYPITHAEKGYYVFRLTSPRQAAQGQLLEMIGGTAPNVVPERCRAVLASQGHDDEGADAWLAQLAGGDADMDHPGKIEVARIEDGLIEVVAHGKSGHGSYPPSGQNAIAYMADYLHLLASLPEGMKEAEYVEDPFVAFIRSFIGHEAFGESLDLACSDEQHGRLTVNLAQISVNRDNAEAVLNIRYPVTADGAQLRETLIGKAAQFGIEVETVSHMAPLYVAPEHPLIVKLSAAYETIMGEPAKLLSIGGGTYARKLQNRGVAFGAGFGRDNHVHQPDEFVAIADMMLHGEICTQAIYELIREVHYDT